MNDRRYSLTLALALSTITGSSFAQNCTFDPIPGNTEVVLKHVKDADRPAVLTEVVNERIELGGNAAGKAKFDHYLAEAVNLALEKDTLAEGISSLNDDVPQLCALAAGPEVVVRSKREEANPNSKYNLYLGTVLSLQDDGSFKSGGEVTFSSRTAYKGILPSFLDRTIGGEKNLIGFAEFTYSRLGVLDEAPESEGPMDIPDGEDPMPMPGGGTDDFSPFSSPGGFFRTNVGLEYYPWGFDRPGAVGGVGFSTRPGDGTSLEDVARRHYFGIAFAGDFGGGTVGQLSFGMAEDNFWEFERMIGDTIESVRESDRYFLDARLDFSNFFARADDAVKATLRAFADLPRSGDGPSDIRLSLLLNADVGKLFGVKPLSE